MITLIETPPKFMPAYNHVAYHISSDNTAEPNFQFVIDVNQQGGSSNPLARLTYPKQPTNNELRFDIGQVLKDHISQDFLNVLNGSTIVSPNTNSRVNYYCDFREMYDVSGVPTLSGILISDPTSPSSSNFKVGVNAVFDFEDFTVSGYMNLNVSGGNYLGYDSTVIQKVQWGTNAPLQQRVLTFFDPGRFVEKVRVSVYDGVTNPNYMIDFAAYANEFIFNVNAGYTFLSAAGITTQPIYYLVELLRGNNTIVTAYQIYIDTECSKYETVRIHWLDRFGSWQAYNFRKVSRNSFDVERKTYKKILPIGYSTTDRLKHDYYTTMHDKLVINTDNITDEEAIWFSDLISSPSIYMERSQDDFVAMNIRTSNYELKKWVNDKQVFNLEVELIPSYDRYRQGL